MTPPRRPADTTSHGNTRCRSGAASETIPRDARHSLRRVEGLYNIPYERFERYSPYGAPETIAEFLAPYVLAGCRTFNLLACADHQDTAVAGVSEIRRLLNDIS